MKHLIVLFFFTFSAAFMATVPPGLLNLNAAKISVKKGKIAALYFSFGVMLVIFIQAYIAVIISKYLYNNPYVIDILLKIAIVIFAALAIYFYVLAKKSRKKKIKTVKVSKKNSFFKGMLLAGINLLTIPYYSGLNAAWKVSGWIKFEWQDIAVFILAAGLGSFTVLYMYIIYFNRLEIKTDRFSKYSDYILSVLMLVLFVITLIRIFYTE
ncbi:LysE family transporter [Abyssalbus ytuae]|uniref:LysE family transporter n=1 Tax=Abyssalbus ytuae TaxID=2926907 RepID=A0A9E6ZPG0_9FLAO|nr:LysE family transporter [Abyssalbus ytuae]UOB16338.1 LysE family transporter [Abyssalbus ytuae]